jgi:hypothetical protein
VTQFAMIHDSYGTVAADMDMLAACLREAFIDMYEENNVLEQFLLSLPEEVRADCPPLPAMGSLALDGSSPERVLLCLTDCQVTVVPNRGHPNLGNIPTDESSQYDYPYERRCVDRDGRSRARNGLPQDEDRRAPPLVRAVHVGRAPGAPQGRRSLMVFNRKVRRRLAWLSMHTKPGVSKVPGKIAAPVPVPRHTDAFNIDGNTSPKKLQRAMRRGYEHFSLVSA